MTTEYADPVFPSPSDEKTSELVTRVFEELSSDEVLVEYLIPQFRHRSFGGLLIILAVIALIPGISMLAGLAILIPGTQMILGVRVPILPRFIRQRTIRRNLLRQIGVRIIPWLERIEQHVKPRWFMLTHSPMPRLIGMLAVSLAIVVILPFPFINFPPAIALIFLSLGLLERDGMLISIGIICGFIALTIGVMTVTFALKSLLLVL
ncbi:MAG: exopolysaccharide biosynthesis protein [SAR324 cluster bacterium]|nr:exopolysaccharide biosynthesis protein [SAR324 cluster bacterium]